MDQIASKNGNEMAKYFSITVLSCAYGRIADTVSTRLY